MTREQIESLRPDQIKAIINRAETISALNAKLRAENERLRKALRPFANPHLCAADIGTLDVERARAALERKPE